MVSRLANVLQFKSRRDNVPYDPNGHHLHEPTADASQKNGWSTVHAR